MKPSWTKRAFDVSEGGSLIGHLGYGPGQVILCRQG